MFIDQRRGAKIAKKWRATNAYLLHFLYPIWWYDYYTNCMAFALNSCCMRWSTRKKQA